MATIVPEWRKLLRLEVRNAEIPIERKPSWLKTRAKLGPEYTALQKLVKSEELHTVSQEGARPNNFECWEDREATFLIGGDRCTRRWDFCQIDTGRPRRLDRGELSRVAESVRAMGPMYATITGVARDDLPDGGAWLYAETVRVITQNPRPSPRYQPVERRVGPGEFVELATVAEEIGFAGVLSGPLVCSSYRAGGPYRQVVERRGVPCP